MSHKFLSSLFKLYVIRLQLKASDLYQQVNIDGITGPVKFNEDGMRAEVELDILNLRNNSFVKVSTTVEVIYFFKALKIKRQLLFHVIEGSCHLSSEVRADSYSDIQQRRKVMLNVAFV